MKGTKRIFAACLVTLGFWAASADEAGDVARAAVRRAPTNSAPTATAPNSNAARGNATQNANKNTAQPTTVSRTTNVTTTATRERNATQTVSARDTATASRTPTQSATQPATTSRGVVSQRTAPTTSTQTRNATTASRNTTTSTARTTASRTTARTAVTPILRGATVSRAAKTAASAGTRKSRAAALTREEILSRNYTACRDVYYECMDEFCANKDSQLKRCACSARINEFDKYKKNLNKVEDKLLDFSQRLLTVSMKKEDAAALNVATEGELAFQKADKTASKKMLDEIAKKLNTSFDSSEYDNGANALNWSLNIDAAFDSVDSLYGASTTTKTGTALYSAALPICREMALEVCTEDELAIAQSGYQVVIEQDCNTVAKTYETQIDQAHARVREGGALLDISRLDTYQDRNSDDILTCKRKMLEQLTDTTVCGEGLGKCLDTTGRYIDPSTGQAFLTADLVNLATLIVRPEGDETWTSAPSNKAFVKYLNSKKKYLEPAMEHCEDIADKVWDAFLEDALGQIKIAQDRKLEDMRQSCTTLTAQCLSKTAESINDFDARALSIFGVAADLTVNAMCSSITNACTALLDYTGGNDWIEGVTEIATDKTYETILSTCREVGRSCIIQACKSVTGNFGLCEQMGTSNNRKAIINRTSCWAEVTECVASAGVDKVNKITDILVQRGQLDERQSFYTTLYYSPYTLMNGGMSRTIALTGQMTRVAYVANGNGNIMPIAATTSGTELPCMGTGTNCIYDLCADAAHCDCNGDTCNKNETFDCRVCRITEKIWGNCEASPNASLAEDEAHNKIKEPKDGSSTLLYWLALNTGTETLADSCRNTMCGIGFYASGNKCESMENLTNDCQRDCKENSFQVVGDKTNCCRNDGTQDKVKGWSNTCCVGVWVSSPGLCVPHLAQGEERTVEYSNQQIPITDPAYQYETAKSTSYRLVCLADKDENGSVVTGATANRGSNGETHTFTCNGRWMLVDGAGRQFQPGPDGPNLNNGFVRNVITLTYDKTKCDSPGATTDYFMEKTTELEKSYMTWPFSEPVSGWNIVFPTGN